MMKVFDFGWFLVIDVLIRVFDDCNLVLGLGEEMYKFVLDFVGVLVFVNEDWLNIGNIGWVRF